MYIGVEKASSFVASTKNSGGGGGGGSNRAPKAHREQLVHERPS